MEKTKFDYTLTFFFLIISSKATFLTHIDIFWFIYILIALLYGFSQKRIYEYDLYVFAQFGLVYIFYIIFRNIAFNHLPSPFLLSDIFYLLKYIFLSYVFCVVMKDKATSIFSEVVTKLAVLSLVIYPIQLIGGGPILFKIGQFFINNTPYVPGHSATFSNFLFFTYDDLHYYRNAGFAWEPGAFGCFLVIAMFFHLLNNDLKFDKSFYLLTIALITTLSTTAYLGFAFLILLLYRSKGGKWNFGIIAAFVGVIISFIYLPFLGSKIQETYKDDLEVLDDWEALNWDLEFYSENSGELMLNRFSSSIFIYRHFKNQLLFGVSNAYVNLPSKIYGVEISKFNISNGIMDFVAKFGIIGLLFLLYKVGKFAYLNLGKFEYSLYWILTILSLGFGEPIFILPVTLIFIFLPTFSNVSKKYNLIEDEQHLDEKNFNIKQASNEIES